MEHRLGGGSISDTGLFIAGQSAGTSIVRATSVADTSHFAEATVTIAGNSPFQITQAEAQANSVIHDNTTGTLPLPLAAAASGSSVDLVLALAGNELTFDGSCSAANDGSQARAFVELVYSASQATTVTLEAGATWPSAGLPSSVAGAGGNVDDAVVHFEVAHGVVTDHRITASIEVEPGASVDVFVEAVCGSGGNGGGRALTITFAPSP